MADRQQPSRRSASGTKASEKKNSEKKTPSRRSDVIRCDNCGEDYSITYKRCPFCDERPGRTGINGRRVDGSRGPVHPIQLIMLVVSLVVIIAALFIVFKYVGPALFGNKNPDSSVSTSQSGSQSASDPGGDVSQPGGSTSGDVSQPDVPAVPVNVLTLGRNDVTLLANETYQIEFTVDPADAVVTWTSSHPEVITVDENGVVRNVNSGAQKVKTTITGTAGDKTVECTVYCQPGSTASTGGTGSTTPKPPVTANTKGVVVNAGSGLNVRSGPGSSYEKVASASNGSEVTILGEENGWYKIDYGGGKTGYVSKDYVSVR